MHEFVLSGEPAKRQLQASTLDVAKRLLDYGFHPPTIYFPLLVSEASCSPSLPSERMYA